MQSKLLSLSDLSIPFLCYSFPADLCNTVRWFGKGHLDHYICNGSHIYQAHSSLTHSLTHSLSSPGRSTLLRLPRVSCLDYTTLGLPPSQYSPGKARFGGVLQARTSASRLTTDPSAILGRAGPHRVGCQLAAGPCRRSRTGIPPRPCTPRSYETSLSRRFWSTLTTRL